MLYKFIMFLLITVQCSSVEITGEQAAVLTKFYEQLVKNSEGGYVIEGKKPLCINGYHHQDQFNGESESNLASVHLREGALVWKELHLESSDILIHVYDGEDSLANGWVHVLLINRPLFLKTVNDNLALFQYVLGPTVSAQGLLDKLTNPKETFHSVLKNDKVLVGILLGYGTQNSIYVSRLENIEEMLLSSEIPPFQSPLTKSRRELQHIALMKNFRKPDNRKLEPSFGHASIDQEIHTLLDQLDVSSQTLAQNNPPFIFGRLKNDERTDQLVKDLEACQSKINDLLKSNDFLKITLKKICPDKNFAIKTPPPKYLSFSEEEKFKLPFLIAANIWNTISDESEEYRSSFIQGCLDSEAGIQTNIDDLLEDKKIIAFSKIHKKIKETELFFNGLNNDNNFVCLESQKLYFRTLEHGSGPTYTNQKKITCRYSFKSSDGEILSDTFNTSPVTIDLSETIYGFGKGLKGMHIGELRQLYIHPNYCYGLLSSIDKGGYLTCNVQLLSIESEGSYELTNEKLPKSIEIPFYSADEVKEWTKKYAYYNGYRIWQHYKKGGEGILKKVLDELGKFNTDREVDISDFQSQNLLNRLHWNLYQQI